MRPVINRQMPQQEIAMRERYKMTVSGSPMMRAMWTTIIVGNEIARGWPPYFIALQQEHVIIENACLVAYKSHLICGMAKDTWQDIHLRENWQAWMSSNVAPFSITGF